MVSEQLKSKFQNIVLALKVVDAASCRCPAFEPLTSVLNASSQKKPDKQRCGCLPVGCLYQSKTSISSSTCTLYADFEISKVDDALSVVQFWVQSECVGLWILDSALFNSVRSWVDPDPTIKSINANFRNQKASSNHLVQPRTSDTMMFAS